MAKKTLILHIGCPKTGSTSIQSFLDGNQAKLVRDGVVALRSFCLGSLVGLNSNALSFLLHGLDDYDETPRVRAQLRGFGIPDRDSLIAFQESMAEKLAEEVGAYDESCHTFIISGETLSSLRPKEIRRLKRLCGDLFDEIKVVCYLRRQDLYVISKYTTDLRNGASLTFAKHLDNHRDWGRAKYQVMLDRWADVFGKEAISARVFERERLLGKDSVTDFCQACAIDYPKDYESGAPRNESLSALEQLILRECNALAEDSAGKLAKSELRRVFVQCIVGRQPGRPQRPTPEEAQALRADFEESNELLRQGWFPDLEKVFSDKSSASSERSDEEPPLTPADLEPLYPSIHAYKGRNHELVPQLLTAVERVKQALA
ncbi:MAG: hypothetical protein Kilf2KO_22740 [Rhodospirillales bacterium]